MSPRGERWFDQEAGPVVRLYALTKGRARPSGRVLDVIDLVLATTAADLHAQWRPPEHRRMLDLCDTPITVADLASQMALPPRVVQVLLGDLIRQGLVEVVKPTQGSATDEKVLRSVLERLRAL